MALTTGNSGALDHPNPDQHEPNVAQHGHVAANMTPMKASKTPSKTQRESGNASGTMTGGH